MLRLIFGGLLLFALIPTVSLSRMVEDKSCREHPRLVGTCFKVQGRLSVYNGAPALRLLNLGTKRVLGISEQRFAVAGYKNVPQEITSKIDQDKKLFGDFLVCPFTRQHRGEMQLVCIESVSNLKVRDDK
jgi:hypothetical protein